MSKIIKIIHNPESVLENVMHKLFWDFETNGSYNLSQSTRPGDSKKKKKKKKKRKEKKEILLNNSLCRPSRPQNEIKRKRKERPCQRTKKITMEHKGNCNQCTWKDR